MLLEPAVSLVRFGDDGEAAREAIGAAVDRLIAAGGINPRLRALATGDELSTATIAALITGLRRLRERGGAIELSAASESAQAVIRLNGLDRVFAFPLVPTDEGRSQAPTRRRSHPGWRVAVGVLALLAALRSGPATAKIDASDVTDPATILARVMERNPSLSSYQSRLNVDVRLISFPFIRQHLEGSTYFKRPANYEVVFDRVPSYAKGFEKLYSDVGDPAKWEQRFAISYEGQAPFENRSDIVLHMVQRVRGMIDHETVFIDPDAWTIDRIRYDYYNGGTVTMTQHFADVGGYTMLASQTADIKIPHVHAIANGTYSDYQTNVAIADSVFTKKI